MLEAGASMNRWEKALRLVGLGWYIGVCIVLGILGGLWLDDRLHTTPIMLIIGLLLGIFIAFFGVYRMVLPNLNDRQGKGK